MLRLTIIALITTTIVAITGCSKAPGLGGRASIKGKLTGRFYSDKELTLFAGLSALGDENVYIIYGNGKTLFVSLDGGANWSLKSHFLSKAGGLHRKNVVGNSIYVAGMYGQIFHSYNNGITWNPIIASTPANGSFAWVVPNTPSTTVKIKLTDLTDPGCKTDTSNNNFTITSSLSVVAPNGGETLQAVVGSQGTTVIMNNAAEKINTGSYFDDGGLQNNYSNTTSRIKHTLKIIVWT
jgi:hypothetical protein